MTADLQDMDGIAAGFPPEQGGRARRLLAALGSRPAWALATAAGAIFLAQALVGLVLPLLGPLPRTAEILLGSALLTLLVTPALYVSIFRPMGRRLVEQARAEARFNDVAENAQEWIWEVDAEGLYTYASPVVERVLGFPPEEIVGKKHFYDLFHPEDREALKEAAFEVFARQESFREFPNRNVHRDGREVWLHTSGVPVVAEDGTLLGYRGADADVTARLEAERERERVTRELHEALAKEIQMLRGIIPICAACKRVRDDAGYWHQVEVYVGSRTGAEFTHGICPECSRAVQEELDDELG